MTEVSKDVPDVAEDGNDEKNREELNVYVNELSTKIAQKIQLRKENATCVRPTDEYFFKLDSSLKKNTAFVKKLKQFTANQLDLLLKDMTNLNLTKYISEVCSALVEAKLKMSDVHPAVVLSCKLHQVYSDFSAIFYENWQKVLTIKSGEKVSNPSKLRVDLRFFAELVSAGIFAIKSGVPMIGSILTSLIANDKDQLTNLSIILSFCRHCGEEYAGLVQKSMLDYSKKFDVSLPASTLLPEDKQQILRNLLKDYFVVLCKNLKSEHKAFQTATRVNRNIMESKGEVSADRKEKLDLLQNSFEKLLSSAQTMSELLNEAMPILEKDEDLAKSGVVLDMAIDDTAESQLDPWGDEETKFFYIELPDLKIFLPNYAPKQVITPTNESTLTEDTLDMDLEPEQLRAFENIVSEEANSVDTVEPADIVDESNLVPSATTSANPNALSTKHQFETFLLNLTNCVNKELIDSASIEFLLNLNTKNNRRKLTNAIFGVQRTRLDILPFYARFVATINLVASDVAVDLAQKLKNEFKYHITKKNQMNIESKIKVVRFIGEMVKFGLYSKIEALFCLKLLLHDFNHHQIEMTCAFLEVAGQYLYNCKDTRLRTNVYLEQMMRLKTANALDSRHVAQIENSYYLVKPPDSVNNVQKVRPPMHIFINHLIFEELNKTNVDKIIKLMRKLNWEDKTIYAYTVKCLSKAYNIRYHLIRCLADLVSGISSYQDKAVVKVIDTVFEDIRAGLEIHSPKLAQRRIAMVKYLGELYNYRLIESSNILNTLYSIISLGVTLDFSNESSLDPPSSLFRLKLAGVLLNTCGQYFTSVASRKKLDYFLVFYQQYYWFKKSDPIYQCIDDTQSLFPILADHFYKECLANVRPKLKICKSYDEAKAAVEALRVQLYPNLDTTKFELSTTENNKFGEFETIPEDEDLTDTNIDVNTEDTSEAVGESDDEIRGSLDEDGEEKSSDVDEDSTKLSSTEVDLSLPVKEKRTQEDIEFEEAFEKLAADSYQERLRDTVKQNTSDIPVPIMAKNLKKNYDQLQGQQTQDTDNSVPFVLMLKSTKGGKQQFKSFTAPTNSALAINLRFQEQKIREEKEKVKRLTLNITERIEEEDYQTSLQQCQRSPVEQRTSQKQNKQQKYKHQKGAPDADLIFG